MKDLKLENGILMDVYGSYYGGSEDVDKYRRIGYTVYDMSNGVVLEPLSNYDGWRKRDVKVVDGIVMGVDGTYIGMQNEVNMNDYRVVEEENKTEDKGREDVQGISKISVKGNSNDVYGSGNVQNENGVSNGNGKSNLLTDVRDGSMEFIEDNEEVITSVVVSVMLFVFYKLFTSESNQEKAKECASDISKYFNQFVDGFKKEDEEVEEPEETEEV